MCSCMALNLSWQSPLNLIKKKVQADHPGDLDPICREETPKFEEHPQNKCMYVFNPKNGLLYGVKFFFSLIPKAGDYLIQNSTSSNLRFLMTNQIHCKLKISAAAFYSIAA